MRCGGYAFYVHAHFIVETIPTIFYAPVLGRESPRGERPVPVIASRAFLLTCSNSSPNAMAVRQNDRGARKEGSFLHTISSAVTP
jgi:hypothetical protein